MYSFMVKDLGEIFAQMLRLTTSAAPTPLHPSFLAAPSTQILSCTTRDHPGCMWLWQGPWREATDSHIPLTAVVFGG